MHNPIAHLCALCLLSNASHDCGVNGAQGTAAAQRKRKQASPAPMHIRWAWAVAASTAAAGFDTLRSNKGQSSQFGSNDINWWARIAYAGLSWLGRAYVTRLPCRLSRAWPAASARLLSLSVEAVLWKLGVGIVQVILGHERAVRLLPYSFKELLGTISSCLASNLAIVVGGLVATKVTRRRWAVQAVAHSAGGMAAATAAVAWTWLSGTSPADDFHRLCNEFNLPHGSSAECISQTTDSVILRLKQEVSDLQAKLEQLTAASGRFHPATVAAYIRHRRASNAAERVAGAAKSLQDLRMLLPLHAQQ